MHPAIISAWLSDIENASPAGQPSPRKRARPDEDCKHAGLRTRSKRQRALAEARPNHHAMNAIPTRRSQRNRSSSPSKPNTGPKQTRTPSPSNRVSLIDNETPRASQHNPTTHAPQLSYAQSIATVEAPPSPSRSPSRDSASSASISSSRPSSPAKKLCHLSDIRVAYVTLGNDLEVLGRQGEILHGRLRRVSKGRTTIPTRLRSVVEEKTRLKIDDEDVDEDTRNLGELELEWRAVLDITAQTKLCADRHEHEAEWNNSVHGELLRLAFPKSGTRIGFRYIPTVKINPQYKPIHAKTLSTSSRMVDYAIHLETASTPLQQAINKLLPHDGSINHTDYSALCEQPIAISIETKTETRTAEEAKVQLAVWTAAQMNRLRELAGLRFSQNAFENLLLPLLYVQSGTWEVFFARPAAELENQRLDIYTSITLGDTSTIEGTFQVLKGLRILGEFADTDVRTWWKGFLGLGGG